jgi:hypothetical protein
MLNKASPAGWVVEVATVTRGANTPSMTYFNVAIGDAHKAIDATRMRFKPDRPVRTVRQLTSDEIAALRLKPGDVKPA